MTNRWTQQRSHRVLNHHPWLIVCEALDGDDLVIGVHPFGKRRTLSQYGALLAQAAGQIANAVEPLVTEDDAWTAIGAARLRPLPQWVLATPAFASANGKQYRLAARREASGGGTIWFVSAWERGLDQPAEALVAAVEAVAEHFRAKPAKLWYWIEKARARGGYVATPIKPNESARPTSWLH